MDCPRDKALSRASLSQNQHRRQFSPLARADPGKALHQPEHLPHGRAGADHRVSPTRAASRRW